MEQKTKTKSICSVEGSGTARMALSAAVEKINELVSAIKSNASKFESLAVDTGNKAIQLGLYLQEATGQQQLELHLFTGLAGVTDDLTFAMAQKCVSLANRPTVVTTR